MSLRHTEQPVHRGSGSREPAANAQRLMEAVARDKSHQPAVVKTMEHLQALAGE